MLWRRERQLGGEATQGRERGGEGVGEREREREWGRERGKQEESLTCISGAESARNIFSIRTGKYGTSLGPEGKHKEITTK